MGDAVKIEERFRALEAGGGGIPDGTADGQVPMWDDTLNEWVPTASTGGAVAEIATTVAGLTVGNGRLGMVRAGSTPYAFSPLLTYDATYGKWVSEEFPLISSGDFDFSTQEGTNMVTSSTSYVAGGEHRGYVFDYKALYDAGLRLMLRLNVTAEDYTAGSVGRCALWTYAVDAVDSTATVVDGTSTTGLSEVSTGGAVTYLTGALSAAGNPGSNGTHLLVQVMARVTSAGPIFVYNAHVSGRWQSA